MRVVSIFALGFLVLFGAGVKDVSAAMVARCVGSQAEVFGFSQVRVTIFQNVDPAKQEQTQGNFVAIVEGLSPPKAIIEVGMTHNPKLMTYTFQSPEGFDGPEAKVSVFSNDVGEMSTLEFNNEQYSITCGPGQ